MNLRHVHPCCYSQRGVAATYFVLPCSYTSSAPKHAEIGWFSVVVGLFLFFLWERYIHKICSFQLVRLRYDCEARNGIEYFHLEGAYHAHLVPLPDHFRANQKLKHVS